MKSSRSRAVVSTARGSEKRRRKPECERNQAQRDNRNSDRLVVPTPGELHSRRTRSKGRSRRNMEP